MPYDDFLFYSPVDPAPPVAPPPLRRELLIYVESTSYGVPAHFYAADYFQAMPDGMPLSSALSTSPDAEAIQDMILTNMLVPGSVGQITVTLPSMPGQPRETFFLRRTDGGVEPFTPPPMRTCTRCGDRGTEDESMFYRRGSGWSSWCRACTCEYAQLRRRVTKHGRRFGVEIECVLTDGYGSPEDPDVICDALCEAGIACTYDGYTHEVMDDSWKIVSDSSVENGWELVSPPLVWAQREQIEIVCQTLLELGATIEPSCGLHVHHEVSDLSLSAFKRLYRRWSDWQGLTDQLVARSRRNGQWCRHLPMDAIEGVQTLRSLSMLRSLYLDRYYSLNISCYTSYGTVEIRQHQGSLNSDKILAWIAYGQAVIAAATNPRFRANTSSVAAFLDSLPFRDEQDAMTLFGSESPSREYLRYRTGVLAAS